MNHLKSILIYFFLSTVALAQSWSLALTTGKTYANIDLNRLVGDSLYVVEAGETKPIPVDVIKEIRHTYKITREFNRAGGCALGFLGFLTGFGIGVSSVPEPEETGVEWLVPIEPIVSIDYVFSRLAAGLAGGTVGFIAGSLIGGYLLGGATFEEIIYDLSQMSNEERIETLRRILE